MKSAMKIVQILIVLTMALSSCSSPPAIPTEITPPEVSTNWIEVYFTDPASGRESGGPDEALAAAIDAARVSVDVAIYSFSLRSIRDALIRAHKRGVIVRMVMESDTMDRSVPRVLRDAGIPILGDRREALMHHKFVIIDRSEVWIGSLNFTTSGTYNDDNNLVRIRSLKIAENYIKEFDEMFIADRFGSDSLADTPNPKLTVDGVVVENMFSPDDGVARNLVSLLDNANQSIYFMAYSFTADDLGAAIRARAAAGVDVAGVMDASQVQSNRGTEFDPFVQTGLDVRRDGNDGQMHHKIIIIDGRIVIMGSYNFSRNAEERNDENVLVVYDTEIAALFLNEFDRVYAQAQP